MAAHLLLLALGVATAAGGGDYFVRGSVGLAAWWRVPPAIVGATVAAFATSSPELSVAVAAAADGRPEIALGDALGSSVVNVGLVLGVAVLVAPARVSRRDAARDLSFAAAAPLVAVLVGVDGRVSRADALVLLAVFAWWSALVVRHAGRGRSDAALVLGEARHRRALVEGALGLGLLVVAGRLIVMAAKGLGEDLGLDEFVTGATLVAVGTSAPELATTVMARVRGHDEVGVGTVLGSNVFNCLWVVAVAALVQPIDVVGAAAVAGVAAALATLAAIPGPGGAIGRARGLALVLCYVASTGLVVAAGP